MSYKDDLRKLREEAGIDPNDPKYNPTPPAPEKTEKTASDVVTSSGTFTPDEKKMSLWQKISLPFVRNSITAILFFLLISLVWVAITHTVVSTLKEVSAETLHIFLIKDIIFVIIMATVMYRVIRAQFARSFHTEQDIERGKAEAAKWEAIQHSMMETVPDMIVYTLDTDFCYTSFNNRHKYSMLRIWKKEINIGQSILDVINDPGAKEGMRADLQRVLDGDFVSHMEKFGDNDRTATYWQTFYAPILNSERKIIGISCFTNNITPLKQAQSKNLFLSYHDPLTELYNRAYCEDVFAKADREKLCPYSLIVADISGMHGINENYGRETGDLLLIKVGEIISKAVKDNGMVARWESDEFVVIMPGVESEKAEAFTNICKCQFPGVTVNGIPLRVHIAFATRTDPDEPIAETMHLAKSRCVPSQIEQ